jgi:iron transport multicopper oxidase
LARSESQDTTSPSCLPSAFFNDITYVHQKVPTLYTALSAPEDLATNPAIYGANTNSFILQQGEIVEIVINNDDPGKHPFHLHGHNFQVIVRSPKDAGFYNSTSPPFPQVPMRRDTVLVRPNGNTVLRFRADNPGIWLFHCHIEWHVDSGLIATMVEAPLALRAQKQLHPVPESHFDTCHASKMSTAGNAGGNVDDFLDLSNANYPPPDLPAGFTAKGIVALVFSTLVAAIGLAVIVWYGLGEMK